MSDNRRRNRDHSRSASRSGNRSESRENIRTNIKRSDLPEDFSIPEDFKGVIQINVQRASDQDTTTQTASPTITLNAVQNQLTQVQVGLANMQSALQALQNQQQLMFMLLLGAPEGIVDRQRLAAQLAEMLRPQQAAGGEG
jgi:hypothetical protein